MDRKTFEGDTTMLSYNVGNQICSDTMSHTWSTDTSSTPLRKP